MARAACSSNYLSCWAGECWAGFDDKIISLYARGMTVREGAVSIKAVHLAIGITMTGEKV